MEGQVPTAEEEVREQETGSVGADVFSHEQHAESHATVFRPPAFDQFGLGFGHVKGHTLNFGDHGHQEQRSAQGHQEDVPGACGMLEVNAFDDVEGARKDGDGEQGEQKWNLVSGELSSRTNTTDEGVLVVGRPTSEEHTDGRNPEDGDGVENGEVGVGGVNAAGKRNHAQNQERGRDDEERRHLENEAVSSLRDHVFLDEELHAVGHVLEEAGHDGLAHPRAVVDAVNGGEVFIAVAEILVQPLVDGADGFAQAKR